MFKLIKNIFIKNDKVVHDKKDNMTLPSIDNNDTEGDNRSDELKIKFKEDSENDLELTDEEIKSFIEQEINIQKEKIDASYFLYDRLDNVLFVNKDSTFIEAAKTAVEAKQVSPSLLQIKLRIGFNRAGRIIDEMEYMGIISPFMGSKNREVLVPNIKELESFLESDFDTFSDFNKTKTDNKKLNLFYKKYYSLFKSEIHLRIEDYKNMKLDALEKERIKQDYIEKERKRRLREEAKQELMNEGVLGVKNKHSRRISQEVKDLVWNRDKGVCTNCGSNEKLEFDHIIPFSKGGSNTYRNIQLLCEKCNREKSNSIG